MKLVLASKSPRRCELLSGLNLEFSVDHSEVNEIVRPDEEPEQVVMALALEKALDVAERYDNEEVIIAADTIVYFNGVMGKPKDEEDAYRMLAQLSGEKHFVYTGIAIVQAGTNLKIADFEKTEVVFKALTADRIERYIATGEPLDKAGAYGIQGYGSTLVKGIKGDYFNVVGLPLSKLEDLFIKHFNYHFY